MSKIMLEEVILNNLSKVLDNMQSTLIHMSASLSNIKNDLIKIVETNKVKEEEPKIITK